MAKITKEVVLEVKKYMDKYPNLALSDIGKIVGVSQASVSDIKGGKYDDLFFEGNTPDPNCVVSHIPHSEYIELIKCKVAVEELIRTAKKSESEEGTLFIDYRITSKILERYFPEKVKDKLCEEEPW